MADEVTIDPNLSFEFVGYCGVDSGQLIIADPCYIYSYRAGISFDDSDKTYNHICDVVAKNNGASTFNSTNNMNAGVAVHTGYGDGTYPVFAGKNEEGRIMCVVIDFGVLV